MLDDELEPDEELEDELELLLDDELELDEELDELLEEELEDEDPFNIYKSSSMGVKNKLPSILNPGEFFNVVFKNLSCAIKLLKLKSIFLFREIP